MLILYILSLLGLLLLLTLHSTILLAIYHIRPFHLRIPYASLSFSVAIASLWTVLIIHIFWLICVSIWLGLLFIFISFCILNIIYWWLCIIRSTEYTTYYFLWSFSDSIELSVYIILWMLINNHLIITFVERNRIVLIIALFTYWLWHWDIISSFELILLLLTNHHFQCINVFLFCFVYFIF